LKGIEPEFSSDRPPGDWIVDGDEALELSGGFEPLHDPLSPPHRQVRSLRPVVKSLVLAMLDSQAHRDCQEFRVWAGG
jgi:hypothetical protein